MNNSVDLTKLASAIQDDPKLRKELEANLKLQEELRAMKENADENEKLAQEEGTKAALSISINALLDLIIEELHEYNKETRKVNDSKILAFISRLEDHRTPLVAGVTIESRPPEMNPPSLEKPILYEFRNTAVKFPIKPDFTKYFDHYTIENVVLPNIFQLFDNVPKTFIYFVRKNAELFNEIKELTGFDFANKLERRKGAIWYFRRNGKINKWIVIDVRVGNEETSVKLVDLGRVENGKTTHDQHAKPDDTKSTCSEETKSTCDDDNNSNDNSWNYCDKDPKSCDCFIHGSVGSNKD